jgi:hypothetical protein
MPEEPFFKRKGAKSAEKDRQFSFTAVQDIPKMSS